MSVSSPLPEVNFISRFLNMCAINPFQENLLFHVYVSIIFCFESIDGTQEANRPTKGGGVHTVNNECQNKFGGFP